MGFDGGVYYWIGPMELSTDRSDAPEPENSEKHWAGITVRVHQTGDKISRCISDCKVLE